jgi:hypothetical protein
MKLTLNVTWSHEIVYNLCFNLPKTEGDEDLDTAVKTIQEKSTDTLLMVRKSPA